MTEDTREEWIARCAARLATGKRMTPKQAYEIAVACYEIADHPEDSPEYAADEELLVSAECAA
ncbi:hypothetical protein [Lamprocystis purpurea]|jgi:hypothetical protein|uniref:hypothetical protein n=1 Tax=Lamprocystis purpurea TaxID=61598 RepID=UPI00037F1FA7|nr:hypothetical protein [Lamprocystis purpurea]